MWVVPPNTIAFNITFQQRTSHFVSSFSPCLLRKGELRFEAMTEPNLGVSHKKIQNRSAYSAKWETFANSSIRKIIVFLRT